MKTKRFFSIILCLVLLITLLPQAAWADLGSDFIVDTDNPSGYTYGGPDGVLAFTADGSYTVSMASGVIQTTTDRIVVASGITVNITLNGVNIDLASAGGCAFDMTGATVNLALEGDNTLRSGGSYAGL